MTLDEAIEILKDEAGLGLNYDDDELEEAQRLGIEALKREQARRKYLINSKGELLPGETEE